MRGDVETYFEDGQWKNKVEGNERASSTHPTKEDATAKGRQTAIEHGGSTSSATRTAPSANATHTRAAATHATSPADVDAVEPQPRNRKLRSRLEQSTPTGCIMRGSPLCTHFSRLSSR